jgi:zinc transporter 9
MQQVVEYLMRDPSVLSVHDVKTIMIGPDIARFKAEIHYNPSTIANKYFNAHNNLPEVWRLLPKTT